MQTCQLQQASESKTATEHVGVKQPFSTHLSVSVENAGLSSISFLTLISMWKKAENLIHSEGHILKAPWLTDEKARLIKSSSSPQPHVVQTRSNNKCLYICDSNCPMFDVFSICSHVAVAEVNGDLSVFLQCIQKGCKPNLTAIATQGLPCGSGRKGGVLKRKRKSTTPIESRSVRQCFQSPDGNIPPPQYTIGTHSDLALATCAYSFSATSPMATDAPRVYWCSLSLTYGY